MTPVLPGKPLDSFFQLLKTRFCLLIRTRNAFEFFKSQCIVLSQIPFHGHSVQTLEWLAICEAQNGFRDVFETLILV